MGFRPERAATLRIDPGRHYSTQALRNAYFDEALRRVKAIPGVRSAGLTDVLPLGHNRTWGSPAKGQVYKSADDYPVSFVRIVSDGYIKAMGMTLVKGRDLTERDTPASAPVIMINETLARRLWPGQDPIGQIIQGDCGRDRQVVGVVGDVRHMALEKGSGSEMYIPIRQCQDYGSVNLVVRSALPLSVLASGVEASPPAHPAKPPQGRHAAFTATGGQSGFAATIHRAAAGRLRGLRVGAGFAWDLRSDLVFGEPKDARDRDSHCLWVHPREACRGGS